jgi:DNA-binding beta-propeller fold protein YncE
MRRFAVLGALAAVTFVPGTSRISGEARQQTAFEIWAADQNGSILYVLAPDGRVVRTLDSAALGNARRPHMLVGVPGDPFVYSANTVSNSVTVLERSSGAVRAVVRDVGKAPHAAQPHPGRPDRIYVSNIAPQARDAGGRPDRGETITEIVRGGGPQGPTWTVSRTLDLRASPALADTARFPSRRPVCAGFSRDGRLMLVTLFDGGLAVVDLDRWTVTRGFGRQEIARHGCGFAPSPDGRELYVTAGSMHESWLYVFDVSGGEPRLVASHNLSSAGQDAHGAYVDPVRGDLWVVHRVSSNVTIHPLATIREREHGFTVIGFVGRTPDLVAFSPDHARAYLTLRGPRPAPTIPHATVGETPGVAIVDVPGRRLLNVARIGNQETGDFHGIVVPAALR